MSALKRTTSYRLYVYARSFTRLEHTSAAIGRRTKSDTESKDEVPTIPLVPKRKDPNAVLKALQSTVGSVKRPMLLEGRSMADPLSPYTGRVLQMEYVRTREAGREAARYVINKWPTVFPFLKPTKEMEFKEKGQLISEERLRWLVSERRVEDSIELYNQLKEKGTVVSLEVMNELLALLAHEGRGNREASEHDQSQKVINWPPPGQATPKRGTRKENEAEIEALKELESFQDEMRSSKQSSKRWYAPPTADGSSDAKRMDDVLIWSFDNAAEKLFAEMETKDGSSYDAMIQGLVKHKNYCRAFDLFTEMRKQTLQASLGTYNMLLKALLDTGGSKVLHQSTLLAKEMNSKPMVQPDITTMNHLLGLSLTAQTPRKQLASKIMREITHLGLEPTLTTFTRLLKAFTLSGEGQVLYEIVDYLEQHPQVLQPKSEHDLLFFLEASYIARLMGDAVLSTRIKQLAEKDQYFLVNNLNFFLSHYLVTIAAHGDVEQLMQECDVLIPNILRPYEWVYGLMFRACEEAQKPEYGLELWKNIRKYRVPIHHAATVERFCGAISSRINPTEAPLYVTALEQMWYQVQQQDMRPPEYLISQTVRMYVLNNDLETAWDYFGYFKKYNYQPMFLALTVLLKGHYARGDREKLIEVMEMLIKQKHVLPLNYIRKICGTSDIGGDTMRRLLQGFEKNLKDKKSERARTDY